MIPLSPGYEFCTSGTNKESTSYILFVFMPFVPQREQEAVPAPSEKTVSCQMPEGEYGLHVEQLQATLIIRENMLETGRV